MSNSNISVQTPAIDVFESDDSYLVRADVPGVAQGEVEIEFHKGRLTLVAKHDAVKFERSIRFPDRVEADGIAAELNNGVLELRLPKAAEVRPRKISIGT